MPRSAREKLSRPYEAEVKRTEKGLMLIPRPVDLEAVMRQIPRGKLVTTDRLREVLARAHQADYTCPLVTGIFVRLIGEAAEEDADSGVADVAPWWRVVSPKGQLNEKLPGGVAEHARRLCEEGHEVLPGRGKQRPRVRDFEEALTGPNVLRPAKTRARGEGV